MHAYFSWRVYEKEKRMLVSRWMENCKEKEGNLLKLAREHVSAHLLLASGIGSSIRCEHVSNKSTSSLLLQWLTMVGYLEHCSDETCTTPIGAHWTCGLVCAPSWSKMVWRSPSSFLAWVITLGELQHEHAKSYDEIIFSQHKNREEIISTSQQRIPNLKINSYWVDN